MRTFRFGLIALVLTGLLAACTGGRTATTAPAGAEHKALIVGLVDKSPAGAARRGQPFPVVDLTDVASRPGAFAGIVVNATWSQLEPSPGHFDFATIDASLAAVATYNRHHPDTALAVRLRVFAAFSAPDWAKQLDGSPIRVAATRAIATGATLGRWWEPRYRSAWAALQVALANRYDRNPVLAEVAVASCSSLTAEPFVMAPSLLAAARLDGWTVAAQQACLDGALRDDAAWQRTAIYYPMNPLAGDSVVTDEVAQRCAHSESAGGPVCILANNALSPVAATTGRSAPTYAEIDKLWTADPTATPVGFQMYSPASATYCASIAVAIDHHARSVELWPATGAQPGFASIPASTLRAWNRALRSGTAPRCSS